MLRKAGILMARNKSCGPCRRCHRDTMENEVAEADVGKEEFTCRVCATRTVDQLMSLLDRLYKFPHNVNLYELMRMVYGKDPNMAYLKQKEDLIDRKGFTWWYCDLDLSNQRIVAHAMLDRYGISLAELINLENV